MRSKKKDPVKRDGPEVHLLRERCPVLAGEEHVRLGHRIRLEVLFAWVVEVAFDDGCGRSIVSVDQVLRERIEDKREERSAPSTMVCATWIP